ncbi:NPCBM-associated, NEW3 domain of alpha-galactosidase [Candidatus Burarchaeum australiense]|nr:NPCBM-associated, NEW3 domain of alpha-galactosidase [Candidatus Burarchaeum australiense]
MGRIWVKAVWTLLLLLLLAPLANPDFAGSQAYFINSELYASITLDNLSLPSTEITSGSTTDVSVVFENTGTATTTATATVYIFNAANALVDTVAFGPAPIVPNQQIAQQKPWATDGLPVGPYTARGNVTYDPLNGTNTVSNELSFSFAIVNGGGGNQPGPPYFNPWGEIKPVPIEKLPPLAPKAGGPVDFLKFPVLKEMVAGQSALQEVTFINRRSGNETVKLVATGVDQNWLQVSAPETTLMPGETRNVDLAISVPEGAQEGDYLIRLDAENADGVSSDFMVVRIKGVSPSRTQPVVLRTVELDRTSGKTTVTVTVRNPSSKDLKTTLFTDQLPAGLQNSKVQFLDRPGEEKSLDGKKYVLWEFPELLSHEQVTVTYTMDGVLTEYTPYVNWYASELVVTQKVDLSDVVKIIDVSASEMKPGSTGNVVATVLYVGDEPMPATMTLSVPAGFTVDPSYLTTMLQPRDTFTARFEVGVPQDAPASSHLLQFLLYTDSGQVSARLPIVIAPTAGELAAAAITVKPTDAALVGILLIALIFAYLLYARRREGGGSSFSEERLEYAKSLSKLVKTEDQ